MSSALLGILYSHETFSPNNLFLLLNQYFPMLLGMKIKFFPSSDNVDIKNSISLPLRISSVSIEKVSQLFVCKIWKNILLNLVLVVILDMFATYLEVIRGRDVSFYMIFSQIQMF